MSCKSKDDCIKMGLKCEKKGSNLFCSNDNGCACSLPIKYKTSIICSCVVSVIIVVIAFMSLSHPPKFIHSSTFCGTKKGYVFKTENGVTGYYLDTGR